MKEIFDRLYILFKYLMASSEFIANISKEVILVLKNVVISLKNVCPFNSDCCWTNPEKLTILKRT